MVVSGVGLVSAAGIGCEAFWDAFRGGRSQLRRLEQMPTEGLAMDRGGEVRSPLLDESWNGPAADRALKMASLAVDEALERAQLASRTDDDRGLRIGLALGTALGPVQSLESIAGGGDGDATWPGVPLHRLTLAIAQRHGLYGPRWTFSVTCASGLYGLEQALADLRFGRADAVLCGGLDTLSRFMQSGFCSLRALSSSGRLRPFQPGHDGIVLGEGAAFVLLETESSARRRGVAVLAQLVGNRLVSDATHLTSPDATGRGMAQAIRLALEEAGLDVGDIGCITPTANGSVVYDEMQSRAVIDALGDGAREIPVTTWEPIVGHVLAGTGILGLVHGALVLHRRQILAIPGVDAIDSRCQLRYLRGDHHELAGRAVLCLTVGFGGQNGATVLVGDGDAERAA